MSAPSGSIRERNQDATLWVGNLADTVDEELLWELFLQAGPLTDVSMPRDKVNGRAQGFAFVEFAREEDSNYAVAILNITTLCGNPIRVRKAGASGPSGGGGGGGERGGARAGGDTGANLFVGNLGPEATERTLYDTFGAFGVIVDAHVQREAETGVPRGFGFVSYDTFEAADAAIEALSGQFLAGRQAVVQFAFRKDAPTERHGSSAERMLAAAARSAAAAAAGSGGSRSGLPSAPNVYFASAHGVLDTMTPFAPQPMMRTLIGGAQVPGRAEPALTLLGGQEQLQQGQGGYWMTGGAQLPQGLMPPPLPFNYQQQQQQQQPPPLPPLPAPPAPPSMSSSNATAPIETVLAGGRRDIRPAWMK